MSKKSDVIYYVLVPVIVVVGICVVLIGVFDKDDNRGNRVGKSMGSDVVQTEPTNPSGNISDKFTFDDLEIVVTKCTFSKYCGGLDGLAPADKGNVWCVVYLDVKNISKSDKELKKSYSSNYNFLLKYKGEYEYHSSFFEYSDFFDAHDSLAPLETLDDVCVSFKVPVEVKDNVEDSLCIQFSKNSIQETDYVEWNLR